MMNVENQQKLLRIHRENVAHYLTQVAMFGQVNVPAFLLHSINHERERITTIKQALRAAGVAVDDHPDDGTGL
jgi:hypothetical protein